MMARLQGKLAKLPQKLWRSYVKRRCIAPVLASVPADATILEVGGGYNPRYTKATHRNVYHLDHGSTEALRAKYAAYPATAHLVDRIQPIDFVFDGAPIETLVPPALRFDVIYGSHVLEHQVDLIGHLQSLQKLLKPGGRVIEMIPDLRTCFDVLRFPTVTSDALLAHGQNAPVHRGKQVFDAMAFEINVNHGYRMLDADFATARFVRGLQEAWQSMLSAELPAATYTDVHAWAFTPESFRLLMIELRLLKLTRLHPGFVSPQYGNQFCAVLELAEPDDTELAPQTIASLEAERFTLARALRL